MAAPIWHNVVQSYFTEETKGSVSILAQGLISGAPKLLELIEFLGTYLTDVDACVRAKGTRLLAEVLHQLQDGFLPEKEVELLCTFMCERLADHHSVQPPALYGLLALTSATALSPTCAVQMCEKIFMEVQNQTLAQQDRRTVYSIISNLLHRNIDVLRNKMENSFVHGYIQVMDAEKDPRNLILAFRCANMVINHFPLGVFVEDMFEVVSCYFPIDFTPPRDDPHGITKDDLILGVRSCLAASAMFGQYCLPLLLEKLTSDVINAKIDSLQTLAVCAEVYGVYSLKEFQSSFFNCIKREVFDSGNPKLEELALSALKTLVLVLSQNESLLKTFLEEVLQGCQHHLSDENLRYLSSTGQLLQAAGSGSEQASIHILSSLMPILESKYTACTQTGQRTTVLNVITGCISMTEKFSYGQSGHNPLKENKSSLQSICTSALMENDNNLKLAAARGIAALFTSPMLFEEPEREVLATRVIEHLLCEKDELVQNEFISVMSRLSTDSPDMVLSFLPRLVSQLKTGPVHSHLCILGILAAVSTNIHIVQASVEQLVSHIRSMITDETLSRRSEDFESVIKTLCTICSQTVKDPKCLEFLYSYLIPELFRILLECSTTKSTLDSPVFSHIVLNNVSIVIRSILVCLDMRNFKGREITWIAFVVSLFLDGDLTGLNIIATIPFKPLLVTSPQAQTSLVSIFTAVFASLSQQEITKIAKINDVMDALLELSLNCPEEYISTSAAKCLAVVINKHTGDEWDADRWLQEVQQKLMCSITTGCMSDKQSAVMVWGWLAKALVLSNRPMAEDFTSKLLELLGERELGSLAANGFHTILSESEDVLNKCTHAVIRLMYRQRFFVENVSKLVQGFETSHPSTKKNYLLVISHLLKVLPKQVLLTELPPLFPLLVQSLMCEEKSLQLSTMNTLYDLTHDAPQIVSKYVDSLIPQLLKLARFKPDMTTRMAALKSLGVMTVLPDHMVLPYKSQVTCDLESVLDDCKRLVRKEAGLARGEWFLVGTMQKGNT